MIKLIRSTFTTIALGLLLSIPYAAPIDAAAKFDDSLNLMTIPNLPACTAANSGSSAAVSDYAGSIAWGAAVGTGGGTRVARVYCDGGSWTVFAGGGGGNASSTQQNFVKAAPITPNAANSSNLRYNDGCSGSPGAASATIGDTVHNCLMFDDHWTTTPTNTTPQTALNLSNWYAGYMRCNGGTGGNAVCTMQELAALGPPNFTNSINYPFSAWCYGSSQGCHGDIMFAYPFGVQTNTANVTSNTAAIAADGTLQLSSAFYDNATAVADTGCITAPNNLGGADCSVVNWIDASITTGGLASPNQNNAMVTNLNTLLPANGGIIQVRMKYDQGLNVGMYPIFECDVVDQVSGLGGDQMSVNYEWGYINGGQTTGVHGLGLGLNGAPNQTTGSNLITTGDDGVGLGDATNWHTYAIEWTGPATHSFNYYIDGVPLPVGVSHVEPNVPSTGWKGFTCGITTGAALSQHASFHTLVNLSNPGGPYSMWVSDVQVYKKPGT